MNSFKKLALFCALLFAIPALAQTTVSGTKVQDGTGTGNLLASGSWTFGGGSPITVTTGGFTGSVTAGTQTVVVKNASSATILTVPNVVIGSSAFSWDTYVVPTNASISGTGTPLIACAPGASYTQTDAGSRVWTCISFNGQAVWAGTPPVAPAQSGLYAGVGVPTFTCTVPCSYQQTDVPTLYALSGVSGATGSTWIAIGAGSTPPGGSTGSLQYNNAGAFGGETGTNGDAVGFGPSAPVDLGPNFFNAKNPAYGGGAKGNARHVFDAVVTASSATITSATANFVNAASPAGDIGKTIVLQMGAGGVVNATYVSGGTVSGSGSCTFTVSNGGGSGATGKIYAVSSAFPASVNLFFSALGTGYTSAPTTATLSNGSLTCSGTITIASTLVALPVTTTITGVTNSTTATMNTNATTAGTGLSLTIGTNDLTAIQAAEAAAQAVDGTVYFPTGQYLIAGALTATAPVKILGDGAFPDYGTIGSTSGAYGDYMPQQTPYLTGSVLIEANAATDALDGSVAGAAVRLSDFGVVFAPAIAFYDTGHGINVGPATAGDYGEMDGVWDDVRVWGQDGNHYGFVLTNSAYWTGIGLSAWGGGGIDFENHTYSQAEPGNASLFGTYFDVMVGGTAHGIQLNGGNLYQFSRPQVNLSYVTTNATGTPMANWPIPYPNKNTQEALFSENSAATLAMFAEDFETAVGTVTAVTYPATGTFDLSSASSYALLPELILGPAYTTNSGTWLYNATQCNSTAGTNLGLFGNGNMVVLCSNGNVGVKTGTSAVGYPLTVNGTSAATNFLATTIYSAAGTALPSCVSGIKGETAIVSDATSPTFLGTYSSGGTVVSPVTCNGTSWVTY